MILCNGSNSLPHRSKSYTNTQTCYIYIILAILFMCPTKQYRNCCDLSQSEIHSYLVMAIDLQHF